VPSSVDTAARLGGDEFALVLRDVTVAQAEAVATRILEMLMRRSSSMVTGCL
jgi:GGDEF domain-containing protein